MEHEETYQKIVYQYFLTGDSHCEKNEDQSEKPQKQQKQQQQQKPQQNKQQKPAQGGVVDASSVQFDSHVPDRIIPRCNVGQILRIEYIQKNYEQFYDQEGIVAGWVRTCRSAENDTLLFIELSDGSTLKNLQIVVNKTGAANFDELLEVNVSFSLRIKGKLIKSQGAGQKIELSVADPQNHYVKVVGKCNPNEYPIPKTKKGQAIKPETLRQIAHLRPRTNIISAITRMRNALAYATHTFYQQRGFMYIHTPIITASDCEGAGEMFQVTTLLPEKTHPLDKKLFVKDTQKLNYADDFFSKQAFLTVSGQLNVENFACCLQNVYTFGPTFRAERSNTYRHLAEFWMIEPEIAFADLHDDMDLAEDYLKFLIQYVLKNQMDDLKFFEERVKPGLIQYLVTLVGQKFKRLDYTEAIEILQKQVKNKKIKFENNKIEWGMDLASEHEKYLAEKIFEGPVMLYNYPKEIKAFYMRQNDDGKTVASFDALVPQIGEVIGGSQREERLEFLDKAIKDKGLEIESYWWYRDLRKYGSVPHAGFGLGFERMIMMCTGVENIKDVIAFPRFYTSAEF